MARFIGMSTVGQTRAPYTLIDDQLVKQDLLNEFYTKKGERVMRPEFGCLVWDVLMDPMTGITEEAIREDITRIMRRDPRVEMLDIRVISLDQAVRIEIDMRYVSSNNRDILYLEYQRNITESVDG